MTPDCRAVKSGGRKRHVMPGSIVRRRGAVQKKGLRHRVKDGREHGKKL